MDYVFSLVLQRPDSLKVDAQDVTGAKFNLNISGFSARVFQHEYDHLKVIKAIYISHFAV